MVGWVLVAQVAVARVVAMSAVAMGDWRLHVEEGAFVL